jgi:hypothetical protein
MNTFVPASSLLSGPSSGKDIKHSPFGSAMHQFRSRSLPNQLSYASLILSTPDAKMMEASRRLSASWVYPKEEYLTRPLVLEPIVIMPVAPYYMRSQYPTVRPCWLPEHFIRSPDGVFGANSNFFACLPRSSPISLHLEANDRFDATYAVASSFFIKNRTPIRFAASAKPHKTRGKDLGKRHPRTCKHCLQSTCKGASTRRSKGFRCLTCPKCLEECLGRCDALATDSAAVERRAS